MEPNLTTDQLKKIITDHSVRENLKALLKQAQTVSELAGKRSEERRVGKECRYQVMTGVQTCALPILKAIARKERIKYVEVLERALDCYAEKKLIKWNLT